MKAKTMYFIIRAVMGLSFNMMFTAAAIYRIDIANLEVYQLILIGTALEIGIFVFETPTGILADLKSRRLSVIIGLFIIGLGFILEGLTVSFFIIFIAQIIWGLGYTFISGALDSWVSDETNNINIEKTLITATQIYQILSIFGIILAGVIGMINIRYAIYLSGILFILIGLISITYMKEHNFEKTIHNENIFKSYYIQLIQGIKHIKKNKVLKYMFVIMLFFGLFSEGIDRTYEIHILNDLAFRNFLNLQPIWIIAIVNSIVIIIGYIILEYVKKHIKNNKHLALWASSFTYIMIIGVIVFGFVYNKYIAVSGFLLFSIAREGINPLLNSILINNTPSKIKATVLSGFGQLDAIGQLLSGALMVSISLGFGLYGIYLATALLLLIPAILLAKTH